eukprot:1196276-Prorocentrum_minimum.AAC.2
MARWGGQWLPGGWYVRARCRWRRENQTGCGITALVPSPKDPRVCACLRPDLSPQSPVRSPQGALSTQGAMVMECGGGGGGGGGGGSAL